jgi:formylglycine-generating enzyme required for sulfatase activity
MAGNASEWIADWYIFKDYSGLPTRNPLTSGPEWNHALRGSSWYDPNGSLAWEQDLSRCSARNSSHVPVDARVGFRCARPVP